jgi:transposase
MVGRYELSDAQWQRIAHLLPGKPGDRGRTGKDNRLFINPVLWMIRGVVAGPARAVRQMEERTQALHPLGQDRSVGEGVRFAHHRPRQPVPDARYNSGAGPPTGRRRKRGAKDQAVGRSRGGLTTKIHTGQAHDCTTAAELLANRAPAGVIADKAYDTNDLRELIAAAKANAVIPSKSNRKVQISHDAIAYKLRNRIVRFFNKLKHFRHIATRYDRRAIYFLAALHLASAMIRMR